MFDVMKLYIYDALLLIQALFKRTLLVLQKAQTTARAP